MDFHTGCTGWKSRVPFSISLACNDVVSREDVTFSAFNFYEIAVSIARLSHVSKCHSSVLNSVFVNSLTSLG